MVTSKAREWNDRREKESLLLCIVRKARRKFVYKFFEPTMQVVGIFYKKHVGRHPHQGRETSDDGFPRFYKKSRRCFESAFFAASIKAKNYLRHLKLP